MTSTRKRVAEQEASAKRSKHDSDKEETDQEPESHVPSTGDPRANKDKRDTAKAKSDGPIPSAPAPNPDRLVCSSLTRKEEDVLNMNLNPVQKDVIMKQFKTDDNAVRLGAELNLLVTFNVRFDIGMMSFAVDVPVYETVRFLKRRLVKYVLREGFLIAGIDSLALSTSVDPETGETLGSPLYLEENDAETFEKSLYSCGFRSPHEDGYEVKIGARFKAKGNDEQVQNNLIADSLAAEKGHAFKNLPLSDIESYKKWQKLLAGDKVDNVNYLVVKPDVDDVAGPSEVSPNQARATSPAAKKIAPSPRKTPQYVHHKWSKWTQERVNLFIDWRVNNPLKTWSDFFEHENCKPELFVKAPIKDDVDTYNTALEEEKSTYKTSKGKEVTIRDGDGNVIPVFSGADLKDKWRNILLFFSKTGEPDTNKINSTRTWHFKPEQVEAISKCIAIIHDAKKN